MGLYADHVFPHLLDLFSGHLDQQRRELLSHAEGRVLELGIGTGASLGLYPPTVTEVVGIDPHGPVLRKARARASDAAAPLAHRVTLHQADAAALPYADDSFDGVAAFLVLCTVPDPVRAAAEAYRVLKPGGVLLVLEHVAARPGTALRPWQHRLDPLWTRAAVGCHLDRDTAANLEAAGFDTTGLERFRGDRWFPPMAPRIRGVLRK